MKTIDKTKSEQEEDFKILASRADMDCKICLGTGKHSWHTELRQYIPCECVYRNIKKELEERSKMKETLVN